jgi:hypothetical protein
MCVCARARATGRPTQTEREGGAVPVGGMGGEKETSDLSKEGFDFLAI